MTLFTSRGQYVTLLSLKELAQRLGDASFVRVHKSYLVAVDKIEGIDGNEISIQTHRIPLSRTYRQEVISQVVKTKLWTK